MRLHTTSTYSDLNRRDSESDHPKRGCIDRMIRSVKKRLMMKAATTPAVTKICAASWRRILLGTEVEDMRSTQVIERAKQKPVSIYS